MPFCPHAYWRMLFVMACTALFVTACANEAEAPAAESSRPAKLVTVKAASSTQTLSLPAVIRAARSSQLTFQVGGQIQELNVLEGQEVAEGDVLATLDQRDYRNNATQARSQYEDAERAYQRARQLIDREAIAQSVLDSRKSQRDITRAALDTAEKALGDTVLRAPFSGAISRIDVKRFQNVQPQEPIAILQSAEVEAVINAPANLIAFVPQFAPVATRVILDAAPSTPLAGVFKEASGAADPNTQTYEASFSFTPPDDLLILPGMTARVETDLQFIEGADASPKGVHAPLAAIVSEGAEKFVWIVDAQTMRVSKRSIAIGDSVGEHVSVTAGLEDGDVIVAAGGSYLHEGMQVRPWRGACEERDANEPC